MFLSEGKKGDTFSVVTISTDLKIKNRLLDMGLTKDARIKVMAYYSKNAYILSVRGSRVVLAKDIAGMIEVERMESYRYSDKKLHELGLEHCS